jgi:ubiquitin carboxyl-terminal hydrolase 36/42
VERLLGRVHSRPEEEEYMLPPLDQSGPVVPETFTAGFMGHVAPWFRRGVQEDSHEFLRLLIDAMQNSCKAARGESPRKAKEEKDDEYPFRLFRGTVESNVTCSSCRAVSCKIDPIEDIGLDILPVSTPPPSTSSRYRGSNSRSASPNNANTPLAAVQEALERFTSQESVAGYKCEKCRKGGKATKTSKLASIPPILTLHLKRFRYGSLSAEGNRRGAPRGNPLDGGPSGSAKIEGHVAFRTILDIKPYLTEELQETTFKKAFCRLFAVVVHNGKNSHSGHYVAYVQSLNNKEWWKMDDAKVSRVSSSEVLGCEAYMLFYRVVDHPVSKELAEVSGKKASEEKRIRDEMERVVREAEERAKSEEERIKSIAALALAIETQIEPKLKEKASEDS